MTSEQEKENTISLEQMKKLLGSASKQSEKFEEQAIRIKNRYENKKTFLENLYTEGKLNLGFLASLILENQPIITKMNNETMLAFNKGVYKENAKPRIKMLAKKLTEDSISKHKINELITTIKTKTYVLPEEIDQHPEKIVMKNGIYNLKTNKLEHHTAKDYHTLKIPVKYNPKADCPKIKKFISEIVKGKDQKTIQQLIGYCLYRKVPLQKAFMFIGEGANGKTTLINLIRKFLGEKNVSNTSLQSLSENRFAAARLKNSLANLFADLDTNALRKTGMFKMLVGKDPVYAEKKFKDGFQFQNYAKLIFSANKLPEVKEDTDAFFRRWIIINFPNIFKGEKANPNLLKELTTEKELSGLFNYAIKGLKQILKNKKFATNKTSDEWRETYKKMSDSLAAFIIDCVKDEPNNTITKRKFYQEYVKHCKKNKLPVKSKRKIGSQLPEQKENVIESTKRVNGKKQKAWRNIKVIQDGEEVTETTEEDNEENEVKEINPEQEKIITDTDPARDMDIVLKIIRKLVKKKNKATIKEVVEKAREKEIKSPKEIISKLDKKGEVYKPTHDSVKIV